MIGTRFHPLLFFVSESYKRSGKLSSHSKEEAPRKKCDSYNKTSRQSLSNRFEDAFPKGSLFYTNNLQAN